MHLRANWPFYKQSNVVLRNAIHSSTCNHLCSPSLPSHRQQELRTVYDFKGSSIEKTLDFDPCSCSVVNLTTRNKYLALNVQLANSHKCINTPS